MGACKLIVWSSHFDLGNMGSTTQFLYQKLVLFVGSFWFSVSAYIRPLFGFFWMYLFRFKRNDSSSKGSSNHSEISSQENSKKYSNPIEPTPELQPQMDREVEAKQNSMEFTDGFDQKERPEFCFKFKFPSYEEFNRSRREIGDSISFETVPDMGTTTHEFVAVQGSSDSIEESEALSISLKELNTDRDSFLSGKDFMQISSEGEAVTEELHRDSMEKMEAMTFTEGKEQQFDAGNNLKGDRDYVSNEIQFQSEKDSSAMDSDSESTSSSPLRSVMNCLIDSYSDGFLSDGDFGEEFEVDNLKDTNGEKLVDSDDVMLGLDENHFDESGKENKEEDHFDEDDTYTMEELRKLEETYLQNLGKLNSDFLSEKDFHGDRENSKLEELGDHKDEKSAVTTDDSGKVNSKKTCEWNSEEDSSELETLWEHQELIEQLKMELKKVRATGLPTILEESESPKIMEDLKPWKIDEKFQHADRMDELHKFYKSYRERMRKFDILNYQKMYAIGFLQLKDPLQSISISSQKPSVDSLFPESIFLCKRKKIGSDPMMKFVKELGSDLEVVYVGQMCLSWEILHWEYGKALDLWESDPRGVRQYNEVAGEFQQFQVLVQRFIEDEPYQAPRVQNYVKTRCVLRNLLQVPVITEDSAKYRKKAIKTRERGDYAITSESLVEIMEESIRIFWRFVRADKDCSNVIVKCRKGPAQVELQDPADSELLMEVRANLQKKEKRLKDLLRSGNCILRRFQKRQEEGSDQVLYFFSQVDMKLVSRVLNMSRLTTDQLIWCRNKLTKINFVNRKIRVEPSFLLFPC